MSASIIDLSRVVVEKGAGDADGHLGSQWSKCPGERPFEFWEGASGECYVHTVYDLVECPELPACNYVLVRRDNDGKCLALRVGRLEHDCMSMNLAEVRHRAARAGASEVHVHFLQSSELARSAVETDIAGEDGVATSEARVARKPVTQH
jgi:hypothetical protein